MPSVFRTILFLSVIGGIPLYFVYFISEGILFQAAGAVILLLLISMILFTGKKNNKLPLKDAISDSSSVDSIGSVELPPPVLSEEGTSEIIEKKLSRSRRSSPSPPASPMNFSDPLNNSQNAVSDSEAISIGEDSNSGLAKIYVANSDAESQIEAEVEDFLTAKRIRRDEIRKRNQRERRMKASARSAMEASKWTELEDGEDFDLLLSQPDHGVELLSEPEGPDPNIPQGISYVRIDKKRIVKIRVPLDVRRRISSDTIPLDNSAPSTEMQLPSLPPIKSGMAPPPPPLMPPLPDLPPPVGLED